MATNFTVTILNSDGSKEKLKLTLDGWFSPTFSQTEVEQGVKKLLESPYRPRGFDFPKATGFTVTKN